MQIRHTTAADAADIETLLDAAFGPDRFRKTAYRLRAGTEPFGPATLIVRAPDGRLCGSISFWPIRLVTEQQTHPALLLGPVAVAESCRGQGLGGLLIETGLAAARDAGHDLVMLVGDAPYYGRFGFSNTATTQWRLPGPVDQSRVLALSLADSPVPAGPLAVAAMAGADVPA